MDIYQCAVSCNYDQACVQKCLTIGSAAGQQVFTTLAQCVIGVCGTTTDAACVDKAVAGPCAQQYAACRQGGA
jgi:hypothetical protein